jgi:hypothetical protein
LLDRERGILRNDLRDHAYDHLQAANIAGLFLKVFLRLSG